MKIIWKEHFGANDDFIGWFLIQAMIGNQTVQKIVDSRKLEDDVILTINGIEIDIIAALKRCEQECERQVSIKTTEIIENKFEDTINEFDDIVKDFRNELKERFGNIKNKLFDKI